MLAEAEAYVNRFLDHWRGLREARQIPRKSALNPIEIKDDLPHLSIHERKDRETFIYRLHGTGIAAHSPVDRTGENVIANTPEIWREAVAMLLNAILDQPCVIREEHTFLDPVLGVRAREGLHLPLADDDDDPRFVLSYYPTNRPARPFAPVCDAGTGFNPSIDRHGRSEIHRYRRRHSRIRRSGNRQGQWYCPVRRRPGA